MRARAGICNRVLAGHHAFKEGKLDLMVNYDSKYRTGRDAEDESE